MLTVTGIYRNSVPVRVKKIRDVTPRYIWQPDIGWGFWFAAQSCYLDDEFTTFKVRALTRKGAIKKLNRKVYYEG